MSEKIGDGNAASTLADLVRNSPYLKDRYQQLRPQARALTRSLTRRGTGCVQLSCIGQADETKQLQVRVYRSFKIDRLICTDYPLEYLWLDADYCAYFDDPNRVREKPAA